MVKRIVFTVTNDLSNDQRMIKICSTLQNHGYQIKLIGFKRKNSKDLERTYYEQERLSLIFQRGKLSYLEIWLRLFLKLLVQKTDIISSVDMDTLIPAFIVSKLRSKILVWDAHEYYSETSGLVGRNFEKSIWRFLEKSFIPRLKYAYTVNESLANIFKKEYNLTFDYILNVPLLEEEEQDDFVSDSESFYLYQGVLNKGRGLEELLQVFKSNSLNLKIAGDGPLKTELQDYINQNGLDSRVEILGYLAPTDLRVLTKKAKVGFNLIEGQGQSYYYSLANKFFDYIHAEIPQICMAFPEYKMINTKYDIAILIQDFNTLNESIQKLESDPELRERLKFNCRKAKNHYQWAREEEKLISFYNRFNSSK